MAVFSYGVVDGMTGIIAQYEYSLRSKSSELVIWSGQATNTCSISGSTLNAVGPMSSRLTGTLR